MLSKTKLSAVASLIVVLLAVPMAYAHGEEGESSMAGIDEYLVEMSINSVIIGSIIVAALTIYAIFRKGKKSEDMKWALFLGISIPVVFITVVMAGGTIYLNMISSTGGPVHWHADFEVWNCGESLDLEDPTGIENRIGSPVFHEHDDFRIHVEGVVVEEPDVDLHAFFDVIGGYVSTDMISMPTNDGMVDIRNGDLCRGQPGTLQAFLYRVENPDDLKNWVYTQEKIENFPEYVLAPYSTVPPGDCLIIEFDEPKEFTDKVCETYRIAIDKGELREAN